MLFVSKWAERCALILELVVKAHSTYCAAAHQFSIVVSHYCVDYLSHLGSNESRGPDSL